MASILIKDDTVTIELTPLEKAEAVHGNVTVPRQAITGIQVVPDGMAEVHGLKMPGSGFPGVIMVGTWRGAEGTTFAVCHGAKPAVVLKLAGQHFDKIVVTVDDPDEAVSGLS